MALLEALLCAALALPPPAAAEAGAPVTRIAFGSCVDQQLPQPIWDAIARTAPQLFLFLGDTIYADTEDMGKMQADYEMLAAQPAFERFRAAVPILAIWDDHDYGVNDGGTDYLQKRQAERLFLDFFEEPTDSPRRMRDGVYGAWIFGPPGKRLQVVLLDGRSFRSPLQLDPHPARRYQPDLDPHKTLLGADQWRWLEAELRKPAEVRLIGSGIQVLGYAAGFECWKNLPREQERLFQVIRDSEAEGVVILSGDAHFALLKRGDAGIGYPLYDLTSSGLTHSRPEAAERPAPLALYAPYGGLNFGTVDIDWQRDDPEILLAIRDRDGNPVTQHAIPLSALRSRKQQE